jgi:hypothetical protein
MYSELLQRERWFGEDQECLKNLVQKRFTPYVERMVVPPGDTLLLWGDLHGTLSSLLASLDRLHALGYITNDLLLTSSSIHLAFLGDLVDRGEDGLEVLSLVMLLKIKNPSNVTIVRGNHEDGSLNELYGFGQELRIKLGISSREVQRVYQLYELLPVALYITSGEWPTLSTILCCHGAFEIGFNPQTLLNASLPIRFKALGTLERFARVSILPEHLKTAVIDHFGQPPSRLRSWFSNNCHQLNSCQLENMTYPYTLGFTWHDFVDDNSDRIIGNKPGRGWEFGRELTEHLLEQDSLPNNHLFCVIRAHQHNGNMLKLLQQQNGIVSLWGNRVWTVVSASSPSIAGPAVHGAFLCIVTGRTEQEWHFYHGGRLDHRP